MSAYASGLWLQWVGHGRLIPSNRRRFYDLHRPFTPRWPVWGVQRPVVSERWKSL